MIRRQLTSAVVVLSLLTLLVGVAYPLVVTGIARLAFPGRADGSLLRVDGSVVGSRLLGQTFTTPRYFHPRPSAAGNGYDGAASGASNLGPTNPVLFDLVRTRAFAYRLENGLPSAAAVPVDAVTASASGLDPQISPENARIQAPRVARVRRLKLDRVLALIDRSTAGRPLGVLGEPAVNVLELNLALDRAVRTG